MYLIYIIRILLIYKNQFLFKILLKLIFNIKRESIYNIMIRVCEKSLLELLMYRQRPKMIESRIRKTGHLHGYTQDQMHWIRYNHQQVEYKGFYNWFTKTDGPLGFKKKNN
jgi:hypothetical protein